MGLPLALAEVLLQPGERLVRGEEGSLHPPPREGR